MIKEKYQYKLTETVLNVTNSAIDSVRNKCITKTGCRVYDNGYLGIAGILGEETNETWERAIKNLERKIPYPFDPVTNQSRTVDLRESKLSPEEFLEKAEALLEQLHHEFPQFIFSNKIGMKEYYEGLSNDANLEYHYYDKIFNISLIFKHIDSKDIFDSGIDYTNRTWDEDLFLRTAREQLKAFLTPVELPTGESLPIIANFNEIGGKIVESLMGESVGRGGSIFSDKMKQQVFHKDFILLHDMSKESYCEPFFDAQGSTVPSDSIAFIDHGTIKRCLTDLKSARDYNLENTACAQCDYDAIPVASYKFLKVEPTGKTLKELVGSKDAIFIAVMSGGDTTNEGVFASPVQTAYLYRDGKLLGKLPEFAISGNIYEMFGKDYVGCSTDKQIFGDHVCVVNAKILKS